MPGVLITADDLICWRDQLLNIAEQAENVGDDDTANCFYFCASLVEERRILKQDKLPKELRDLRS